MRTCDAQHRGHQCPGTRSGHRQSSAMAWSCQHQHDQAVRPPQDETGRQPNIQDPILRHTASIGAQRIGIIQSLLTTCQLQDIDPYIYLVDVLQRINQHPAQRVIELTPRIWKTLFADQSLVSFLNSYSRRLTTHGVV